MELRLTVAQPSPNQEFPVGVDLVVQGLATGTGGAEPHSIDSVAVRVAGQPAVQANLSPASGHPPILAKNYEATVRMNSAGRHQIVVTATDDIGRSVTITVPIATTGMTNCQADVPWTNYSETQSAVPEFTCAPASLSGLVAAIREAEAAGKHAHAFGSRWSFSDCALTNEFAIDTRALYRRLQTVHTALLPGQSTPVFHVEAGIGIDTLYRVLSEQNLALETMGGASGQTLAGALSTGTHGGDKFLAPLADSVFALHLVGAGGTQYWIEPSKGVTDPALLRERVIPDVSAQNIIYDDATFNACLISLGCMGVIYAVVLRVREPYDLVETTTETNWRLFKLRASGFLNDPDNRFLQVVVDPYRDSAGDNLCLVTTRSEAPDTGPGTRPRGDVESAVRRMIESMDLGTQLKLWLHGVFDDDPRLAAEERLAKVVQGVLTHAPDQRSVMVEHYANIMRQVWPTEAFRGSSYSVMDIGYGQLGPTSQAGYSIELFFPSVDENGRLGFTDFIDALIFVVNNAVDTFFTGYVSLRFTGPTRAVLGMQRWSRTCAVEISLLKGVQGLDELISQLYRIGLDHGALPHWGQMVDLGIQGYAGIYPQYAQWRQVYARMSDGFTKRTFENSLSTRWNLTTPNSAQFVSQTVSPQMVIGQSQTVTVTLRNTGASTWTVPASYRLGSQNPQDNVVWGLSRTDVPMDMPPGATATFQFSIVAPAQPGGYRFQWRMLQEEVEWFGDYTPDTPIVVNPPTGQTIVPDVREETTTSASEVIRAAGLIARFTGPSFSDSWVASQAPRGGAVVNLGTTVTCHLKRGLIP